jgi:hypothetical protein
MTTKTERFFTWVWRVNGLLVLIAAVLCLIGLVAILESEIFGRGGSPRNQLTDVAGADLVAEDLRLGGFRSIDGTDYIYATLAPPSRYGGSGSSRGNARNWLFFNTESRNAHWLFPDTSQKIIGQRVIYQKSDDEAESNDDSEPLVAGILMTLADVNAEPNLPKRLILVSADGKSIVSLEDSVDGLLHDYHVSSSSHLIFYSKQRTVYVMELNPVSAEMVSNSVLSATQ